MNQSLIEIQAGFDEPMETDLSWLVRNIKDWPPGPNVAFVSEPDEDGNRSATFLWYGIGVPLDDGAISKEVWRHTWLNKKSLELSDSDDDKEDDLGGWVHVGHGEVLGDWRNTLEKRPDHIVDANKKVNEASSDTHTTPETMFHGTEHDSEKHSEQPLEMVGRKADQDKPRMDLIPPHAEKLMADVLTFGAKKYSPGNWRKVPDLTNRYTAAAMRHINDYRSGNAVDSETGIHHLAHAMCCLAFIIENDVLSEVERHAENPNPAPAS